MEMSVYNVVHNVIALLRTDISYVGEGKEAHEGLSSSSLQYKCKEVAYIDVHLIIDTKFIYPGNIYIHV